MEKALIPNYAALTRDALRILASQQRIAGRGSMSKEQLVQALIFCFNKKQEEEAKKIEEEPNKLGVELRKKVGNYAGNCSYVVRGKVGDPLWNEKDACYARLKAKDGIEEAYLDVIGHYSGHQYKEAYKEFVLFILNESHYKNCFLTKTWEELCISSVKLDVSNPHSDLVTAAVALRQGSEYPTRMKMWEQLKPYGFRPKVRWALSYFFFPDSYRIQLPGGGHMELEHTMEWGQFVKTVKEGLWINKENKQPPASVLAEVYKVFNSIADNNANYYGNMKATYTIANWMKDNGFTNEAPKAALWGKQVMNVPAGKSGIRNMFKLGEILETLFY